MNQVPALTVVTGGAQGLGMAVAMLLVSAGRPVVLVDMNTEALAQAQTALAALGGGQVTGFRAVLVTEYGVTWQVRVEAHTLWDR